MNDITKFSTELKYLSIFKSHMYFLIKFSICTERNLLSPAKSCYPGMHHSIMHLCHSHSYCFRLLMKGE